MKEKKEVGIVVKVLSNEIKRCLVAKNCGDGLTHMQCRIIGYLVHHENENVFQKNIEADFNIRRSTATGILKLMEKNGLIFRTEMANDARLKKLNLTSRAVEIHENATSTIENIEKAMAAGIAEEDMETFFRVSEKMHQNLKAFRDAADVNRGSKVPERKEKEKC